ncbi:MAG: hypothetical protein SynsKO_40160 [Synoicihabitans sp.]
MAVTLLVGALAWHGFSASRNWNAEGLTGHGFRQGQTALTIQAMMEDGFRIDYSTPILGKPWAIPMEFPLYQGIVATLTKATGWPIAPTGRGVSLFFFGISLPAFALLARRVGLSWSAALLVLIPIILAPNYLFYSRAVLIESLALASSAWFLVGVLLYRERPGWRPLLLAVGAGLVAVLTKPTTWSGFCVPWAILWIGDAWRALRQRTRPAGLAEQALLIGVPLLVVGFGWVWIADQIKALNPNASFLLSGALREFNYGTLAERTEADKWLALLAHIKSGIGTLWAIGIGLIATISLRKTRAPGALALAAFAMPPLLFFGLYFRHDYYFYANTAFLAGAMGLGVAILWDRGAKSVGLRLTAIAVLGAISVGQWQSHRSSLWPQQLQFSNGDSPEVLLTKTLTKPHEVVVVHSASWSSEIAYFSERRFLVIPDFQMFFNREDMTHAMAQLADEKVALLFMSDEIHNNPDWKHERLQQLGFMNEPFARLPGTSTVVHTSRKRHDLYRMRLAQENLEGWEVTKTRAVPVDAPDEDRVAIAAEHWPDGPAHDFGPRPEFGALPFGMGPMGFEGDDYVIAHGGTELYFIAPPDATRFRCSYLINPESFDRHDWDGIEVMLEGYSHGDAAAYLNSELIEAEDHRERRTLEAQFEPSEFGYVRVRILPGLRNQLSFDHAWIAKVAFE